ncbi:hypothetical protein [Enterococcus sp. LJL51]|uniref:hypothetical protein n=1 Tax=Enterococcus sp. LJL51 TaxID=3416656 RepID=UPI003CFAD4A9
MTPWEYTLRMKAYLLNENEKERRVFQGAFANRLFKAEKKGKYLFRDVKSIYDYEKNEEKILADMNKNEKTNSKKDDLYEMQSRLERAKAIVKGRKEGKDEGKKYSNNSFADER